MTPVKMSGGCRTLRHEAVTWGMSVMEFFIPGEKEPKGRLGRRSRNRQRLDEEVMATARWFPRDSRGIFTLFTLRYMEYLR